MMEYTESKRKGQFNLLYSDNEIERMNFVFHSNTLVPVRDTLHFGIKPGHFMLYVKRWDEDGKWLVKDAGYINYFRKDQHNIIQTDYNTIQKQKLLSKGYLWSSVNEDTVTVTSTSLLPLHRRKIRINLKEYSLDVFDYFVGKTTIYFNVDDGKTADGTLIKEKKWFFNKKVINY